MELEHQTSHTIQYSQENVAYKQQQQLQCQGVA